MDGYSALPSDGISIEKLCDAFMLAAVALDLRDPLSHDGVYKSESVPAAMASPGGAVPTFELVRRRIDEWGCRLLQALNADDPGSDCDGSLAARTASAEALHSALVKRPVQHERALPMLFRASMIDIEVTHHSAGGRRVLQLCKDFPDADRPVLIGLLNGYEGRNTEGRRLHRDIEPCKATSWLKVDPDRMPNLTREMFKVLKLGELR